MRDSHRGMPPRDARLLELRCLALSSCVLPLSRARPLSCRTTNDAATIGHDLPVHGLVPWERRLLYDFAANRGNDPTKEEIETKHVVRHRDILLKME